MLKLSKVYSVPNGHFSVGVFDLVAETLDELKRFWKDHHDILDRPTLHPEEIDALKMTFKMGLRDKVEGLMYRFNMVIEGRMLEADKKEFFDQFKLEAIKGIIYATDYLPNSMTIDQYAGIILSAYDQHGDTILFDQRILNIGISDGSSLSQVTALTEQVRLFKQLMTVDTNAINGQLEDEDADQD